MTEEEKQRTIDFLAMLDGKRPRVSVKPEPTNEFDLDAFVVRYLSRKAGYVRDNDHYKGMAHAALEASGKGFFYGRVVEVVVADNGYFDVEVDMKDTPVTPTIHEDRWSKWNPGWPAFPLTEQMLCVEDAIMMMAEDEDENLAEYVSILTTCARHAVWREAREGMERAVRMLEAKAGDEMRRLADELEHLLTGMCNEYRTMERRDAWLPQLMAAPEAETAWRGWLKHMKADTRQLDELEMTLWLAEVEGMLASIPALAPCATDDDAMLLTRGYYTLVPLHKMRLLLTGLVVRKRLRDRLGLPSAQKAPAPSPFSKMEHRFVANVIDYAGTLPTADEVKVLQTFIYHHMPYLPPAIKLQVDAMTHRFLSEEERQKLHTEAMQKAIASQPKTEVNVEKGALAQITEQSINNNLLTQK